MLDWTDEELAEAGLDKKKVESIVRRLNKIGKEMEEMNLSVYGASGDGHLIHVSRPTHTDDGSVHRDASIASLRGNLRWDGGDW